MMKVMVRYEDGNYWLEPWTEKSGAPVKYVSEDFWKRYQQHVLDSQFWRTIIVAIDKE